jgi:hypothetical protein
MNHFVDDHGYVAAPAGFTSDSLSRKINQTQSAVGAAFATTYGIFSQLNCRVKYAVVRPGANRWLIWRRLAG